MIGNILFRDTLQALKSESFPVAGPNLQSYPVAAPFKQGKGKIPWDKEIVGNLKTRWLK